MSCWYSMPRYTFHYHGDDPAPQFLTEPFEDDSEAKRFAERLVAHFRKAVPEDCDGAYLTLTNELDETIARYLLSTAH